MTDHIDTAAERANLKWLEGNAFFACMVDDCAMERSFPASDMLLVKGTGDLICDECASEDDLPRHDLTPFRPFDRIHRLLDTLDAERARAEKAEAERDTALARLAAAQRETAWQCASTVYNYGQGAPYDQRDSITALSISLRALPIDPDAEAALQRVVDAAVQDERERIAGELGNEADLNPCTEDSAVIRGCAQLVKANFSHDAAEALDAHKRPESRHE